MLSAGRGDAGEQSDAEDSPPSVADQVRNDQGFPRVALGLVDPTSLERKAGKFRKSAAFPPAHTRFPRHNAARGDQFDGAVGISSVPRDRTERTDRLGFPPPVLVPSWMS